jgi:PAS domain-containing protein
LPRRPAAPSRRFGNGSGRPSFVRCWPPHRWHDSLPRGAETLPETGDDESRRLFASFNRLVTLVNEQHTQLVESEATYRSLFDNLLNASAYCKVEFENDQATDWTYVLVNNAFTAQTGLQDVIGRRVTEVVPGIRASDPQLFEIYGRGAKGGATKHFDKCAHRELVQQLQARAGLRGALRHL